YVTVWNVDDFSQKGVAFVKQPAAYLVLLLLLAACFSLATFVQPRALAALNSNESDDILKLMLGDGSRLIAERFFTKADIYFHSGYYPSIFDRTQAPKDSGHMTAEEGSTAEEEHEKAMQFLGKPKNIFEQFGRNFFVTEHTHLAGGNEREILPWLR